jgi:hypothetical protein
VIKFILIFTKSCVNWQIGKTIFSGRALEVLELDGLLPNQHSCLRGLLMRIGLILWRQPAVPSLLSFLSLHQRFLGMQWEPKVAQTEEQALAEELEEG